MKPEKGKINDWALLPTYLVLGAIVQSYSYILVIPSLLAVRLISYIAFRKFSAKFENEKGLYIAIIFMQIFLCTIFVLYKISYFEF